MLPRRAAEQISAELHANSPRDLNPSLLATDSQIGAVQIVDHTGKVLAASAGAPTTPLKTVSLDPGNARSVGAPRGRTTPTTCG